MGLLEWIGEGFSPGPRGDVSFGGWQPDRPRGSVIVRAVVALILLGGAWFVILRLLWPPSGTALLTTLGATLLYLFIAYYVRPEPDTDNLGLFGGLIDHPFRWSDDWNRTLLFLKVVLWPGAFVAESLVGLLGLMRGRAAGR